MKKLSILGSTGSIGTQSLEIARHMGYSVEAISGNKNLKLLEEQTREFKPSIVAVFNEQYANYFKKAVADLNVKVVSGVEGLIEVATAKNSNIVISSVVGMVGLQPTLSAIKEKKDIALANKETLVAGGDLVMQEAKKNNVKLLPVDSEHSAIFQCLQGATPERNLKKLILTASGGPFFGKTRQELKDVTVKEALNHPNWSMGAKITIDSATMMNKGLEVIEASWLFNVDQKNIDTVVHRESVIHSMIEYNDHSVIAQMGVPDMKIPIQYALTYPQRVACPVKELSFLDYPKLTFYPVDNETFGCLNICRNAIAKGGLAPAIVNGANEEAVALFLNGKIKFLEIESLVSEVANSFEYKKAINVDDVLQADRLAREKVLELAK